MKTWICWRLISPVRMSKRRYRIWSESKGGGKYYQSSEKYAKQPVIMKLSPNVTDITEMARAVEAGGADVVSLINTLTGMKIDIKPQDILPLLIRPAVCQARQCIESLCAWYIR